MPASLSQTAATEIRAEMGRQRLSQTDIANIISRSQTYVWRRLNGDLSFDLAEMEAIAAALGRPIEQFLAAVAS